MFEDIRTEVQQHFKTFMQRETLISPRDVAWFTEISHETVYQFLKEKRPSVFHAACLVHFMTMVHKMKAVIRPMVEEWEQSSPAAALAVYKKIEGEVPPDFMDIMASDADTNKKVKLLTASMLHEKKKKSVRPSREKLEAQYEALKELE